MLHRPSPTRRALSPPRNVPLRLERPPSARPRVSCIGPVHAPPRRRRRHCGRSVDGRRLVGLGRYIVTLGRLVLAYRCRRGRRRRRRSRSSTTRLTRIASISSTLSTEKTITMRVLPEQVGPSAPLVGERVTRWSTRSRGRRRGRERFPARRATGAEFAQRGPNVRRLASHAPRSSPSPHHRLRQNGISLAGGIVGTGWRGAGASTASTRIASTVRP